MSDLEGLFAPERIAVIGATERSGSVGRAITANLVDSFAGELVGVNPKYDDVLGVECVDSVAAAGEPDLAVVVVPPENVLEVLPEIGAAGIRNVVVITAGFSEVGGAGLERERELRRLAEQHELNLVGPNCLGIMGTPVGMNASFAPAAPLPGPVSFMSQSGAFVTAVLDWAADQGIGFRNVVSLGNKAVLDERDFLADWSDDAGTAVIIGYLEGIDHGREFIEVAREAARSTPIVMVKSGRTEAGAKAASSHTGAIAGRDRAYEAGFRQAGVLRAETVEDLFDMAQALAGLPTPEGDRLAIVTNAGGPGVLATDAVGDAALELASFGDTTLAALEDRLPAGANLHNPVDIIGDADAARFGDAATLVLEDAAVDLLMVLACPTAVLEYEALADTVVELREAHDVPIVACLMGSQQRGEAVGILREARVPNYFDPARAVDSLGALVRYRAIAERTYEEPTRFSVDRDTAASIVEPSAAKGGGHLGIEAMALLEAYGIETPRGEIVDDPQAAERFAATLPGPAVMKIVSPDIIHKTDIGGVVVGVAEGDVYDTYEDLVTRARNYQPDAHIVGVQVQEQVPVDEGVETILGMHRDPQFGPLLMFGLGGIFVEVLEDTTFRVAPISRPEAERMLDEIDAAPLLRGARGRQPVDEAAIVDALQRLSQLVTDFPEIVELDINPLVALPDGVQAIDVRLTVSEADGRGEARGRSP